METNYTMYANVKVNPDYTEIFHRTPIAFDLDSVLNETTGQDIAKALTKEFGIPDERLREHHPDGYEMFNFKVGDVPVKEVVRVVNKAILEDSPSALASPFMSEVMDYVYKVTEQPITVITARHPMNVGVTYRWLEEHLNVPFIAYVMHGRKKETVLQHLGSRIFIDDRWKTIQSMIDWGGLLFPVIYSRPWNENRPKELDATRIRDLRDIIPLLNINLGRNPMEWPHWVPYPKPNGERKKYVTEI